MTYGEIMRILAERFPGYAVDCRPADGIGNALIVWTKDDTIEIMQYSPLLDCFFKIGEKFGKHGVGADNETR